MVKGIKKTRHYVLRGRSFNSGENEYDSIATRDCEVPTTRRNDIGFRIVEILD